jgi:hypothetical protein
MHSYEEIDLLTSDGVRIKAFLIMYDELEEVEKKGVAAESRPTVILLHANAGNVVRSRSSHRLGLSLI